MRSSTNALRACLVAALLLSGCAVALAPGYFIEREEVELHYSAATPDRVQVRATYRLKNVGNADLTSLKAFVPAQAAGRRNLRATVEGQRVSVLDMEDGNRSAAQIGFQPPWPMNKKHNLVLEHEISLAALGIESGAPFHLEAYEWFPELVPAERLFARGAPRAEEVRVRIRVPQGVLVQASGRELGARRRGAEVEYRYDLRKEGFDPFVALGRYHEQEVEASGVTIKFWTHEPLDADAARRAGQRLATTLAAYLDIFGPLWRGGKTFWVVESGRAPAPLVGEAGRAGLGFPRGALVGRELFARGVTSDAFLEFAEARLARTWFGRLAEPDPEVGTTLSRALLQYAVLVVEQARSGDHARGQGVAHRLAAYDRARAATKEKPVAFLAAKDLLEEQEIALHKTVLFLIAIEDRVGTRAVRAAIRRMVQAMRGDTYRFAELRSAVEAESGQNLADFFRAWLNEAGLPEEFRQRYAAPPD